MSERGVGFIGLGAIGLPMAEQVRAAGFRVLGVDPSSERRQEAESAGIRADARIADAEDCDVVVVMVATPDQVDAVVEDAVRTTDVRDQCWIITSTVGPKRVASAAEVLQRAGARVVDSPVTGGVARARNASLILFVAGEPSAIAACVEVLDAMGDVREVGPALGTGQSYKLVNQHLCVTHLVAAAEALALAGDLGLDQEHVLELLQSGAASSWMLRDRGPRMLAAGPIEVTSRIAIMQKDCALAEEMSLEFGAHTPLLDAAAARFRTAVSMGLLDEDDSQVIRTYRLEPTTRREGQ